jgi:hypothetical protein
MNLNKKEKEEIRVELKRRIGKRRRERIYIN